MTAKAKSWELWFLDNILGGKGLGIEGKMYVDLDLWKETVSPHLFKHSTKHEK